MGNMQQMTIGSSPVYLYIGSFTITSFDDAGYPDGHSQGYMATRSPTTLIDGKTVLTAGEDIYYTYGPAYYVTSLLSTLQISGFSSDPGIGYFTYAQYGGAAMQYSSAAGYGYASGTATWTWDTLFGFYQTAGTTFRIVR